MAAAHKPKLADLETELRHTHGWVQLGLCLDLPKHTLEEIHATHSSGIDAMGKCKTKMLSTWLERCNNPTWSMLIAALQATGKWATANKIAFKYGESVKGTKYSQCASYSVINSYIYKHIKLHSSPITGHLFAIQFAFKICVW